MPLSQQGEAPGPGAFGGLEMHEIDARLRALPVCLAAPRGDVILLGLDERTAAVWIDGAWRVEGAGSVSTITRARRDVFASGKEIRGLPRPGVWEADPP